MSQQCTENHGQPREVGPTQKNYDDFDNQNWYVADGLSLQNISNISYQKISGNVSVINSKYT
jgi:hypothetical protein